MAKYDPLKRHLRRQKTAVYELTFRDIERILSALLPKSASYPEWWANESSPERRHVQRRAWLGAGYQAFLVSGAERVRFERQP